MPKLSRRPPSPLPCHLGEWSDADPAAALGTRPPIAEILERWEHVLFPIVLIGLGIFILVSGGAFGL